LALREIEPERIDIRPKMSLKEYLRTITSEADLILDTFPYCGGVTTAQALWMGVPTVTLNGASAFERTAASLMTCAGLSQYVANSKPAYIQVALDALANEGDLKKLRKHARKALAETPIVDGAQFARAFEDCIAEAWSSKASEEALPDTVRS
jgi:predicted O-linked N-acetylglucosamine transferase (SPINDLY family)